MNKQIRFILWEAMIATIYVVLVYIFQFMSFEVVQFRIAEILLVLVFFNPKHVVGLSIGTFVANLLLSTLGIIDPIVGTTATLISLSLMYTFRKMPIVALMFPVVINAILVGAMLNYVFDAPFIIAAAWVALGEAAVLYALGYPTYRLLKKNPYFIELMES